MPSPGSGASPPSPTTPQKITAKPDTIEALWDPAHAGKVGWRDDALESIQMAALATGQDMNNPADIEKIKEKLTALKSQIKTFWSSEDEWNKYMAAGDYDIAVYWSGSAARSKKAMKLPVEFVVPKEGAIGWFDGLTIAKDAPNAGRRRSSSSTSWSIPNST